jgi:hypothetical protein
MSPREKEETYNQLHLQAIYQQRKQQIREIEANQNAHRVATRSVSEVINQKSDTYLLKQFYHEFRAVIEEQITATGKVSFVEVLDQLHFIDEQLLVNSSEKMNAFMHQTKASLVIETRDGQLSEADQDIVNNLFIVCCAILNIKQKTQGVKTLENRVFKSYLYQIQEGEGCSRETRTIDQLWMIKGLVNRSAFALSDNQLNLINRKLQNLCIDRKNHLYSQRKSEKMERVHAEMTPSFSPKTNRNPKHHRSSSKSSQKQQSVHHQRHRT